jgi:hypothetical protein
MTTKVTAKLNVQKGSAYAHLNGQVFEVVQIIGRNLLVLDISGTKTDFLVKEVTDLQRSITKENAYVELTETKLYHELEFLIYENGRIARGHDILVKSALAEALQEMRNRKFNSVLLMRGFVIENHQIEPVLESVTHLTEAT